MISISNGGYIDMLLTANEPDYTIDVMFEVSIWTVMLLKQLFKICIESYI